jgi:hypothetical protein
LAAEKGKDMILIKDNAAEMLDSLTTYQRPHVDKWGDFKVGLIKK